MHQYVTLCCAACGVLVAQRLNHNDSTTTVLDQKCLLYLKITFLAVAKRAPWHVPDADPSLRFLIALATHPVRFSYVFAAMSGEADMLNDTIMLDPEVSPQNPIAFQ